MPTVSLLTFVQTKQTNRKKIDREINDFSVFRSSLAGQIKKLSWQNSIFLFFMRLTLRFTSFSLFFLSEKEDEGSKHIFFFFLAISGFTFRWIQVRPSCVLCSEEPGSSRALRV